MLPDSVYNYMVLFGLAITIVDLWGGNYITLYSIYILNIHNYVVKLQPLLFICKLAVAMERTGLVWIFSASLAAYFLCNPEIGMVKEVEAIDVDIYMYMYIYMFHDCANLPTF